VIHLASALREVCRSGIAATRIGFRRGRLERAQGFFVTGTDTGVGKTLVACALLRAFARTGKSVVA